MYMVIWQQVHTSGRSAPARKDVCFSALICLMAQTAQKNAHVIETLHCHLGEETFCF